MKSSELSFGVSVQTDANTGDVAAVYFQIRRGKAAVVKERAAGSVFVNYDKYGEILGVELLAPCEITVLDRITRREPRQVRNFFRQSVPRQMAIA
jgi:uncharacterized protein YuzE